MGSNQMQTDGLLERIKEPIDEDIKQFIIETLQKKDRILLLEIEKELIALVRDDEKTTFKFQSMPNPYHRMLVHRAAALFNMEHNLEKSANEIVVTKTKDTCMPEFRFDDIQAVVNDEPKKLLKRDSNSFEGSQNKERSPDRHGLVSDHRSKSFEERERTYVKARERIFNQQDSTSSNDGCDASSGNTISDGAHSPSLASVSAGQQQVPTADSSLDDLQNLTLDGIRPWSSVESDGSSSRNPKLVRQGCVSLELPSSRGTSAVSSPSSISRKFLTPNDNRYIGGKSGSATDLGPRGERPKLGTKANSYDGMPSTSTSTSTTSATATATATATLPPPPPPISITNTGPASADPPQRYLPRQAYSLASPNVPNGASRQQLRRAATIHENPQSRHQVAQGPLLANPSVASSCVTSQVKPQPHHYHQPVGQQQQPHWTQRRSDNSSNTPNVHRAQSFQQPIAHNMQPQLNSWPMQDPNLYYMNRHLANTILQQQKDQQFVGQQQQQQQQPMFIHQLPNYMQGDPNQGQNMQAGPIQPLFYAPPGHSHLTEVKLAEPARNGSHVRLPTNNGGRWPLLNEPRIQHIPNNGMRGQNQSLSMPHGFPATPQNYMPFQAPGHHQQAHPVPGQDVRFFYMNTPPPQVMMMAGQGPQGSGHHRTGPGSPAVSYSSPAVSYSGPFQGPVSLPMTQTTHHPIPAPMQAYVQPGQGQGQPGPGLLPMPLPFANQGPPNQQHMTGQQFLLRYYL